LANLQLPMLEIIWEQTDSRKHRGPLNTEDAVKCQPSVEHTPERQQFLKWDTKWQADSNTSLDLKCS